MFEYEILVSRGRTAPSMKYEPQPGEEIPGWYAAKLASEGRAGEVEWLFKRCPDWRSFESLTGSAYTPAALWSASHRFRLNPAPASRRPFRMEEVPLEHWYRDKNGIWFHRIASATPAGMVRINDITVSLSDLAEDYEHSPTALPGTWESCDTDAP